VDKFEVEAMRAEMASLAERNYTKLKKMSAVLERLTAENVALKEENLRLREQLAQGQAPKEPNKRVHLTLVTSKKE